MGPSMIAVSPSTREARGSQAQPSHSISQQRPQPESRVPPNEQYRVDPLMARQTGIPSEPAAAISAHSSQSKFVPVVTYVPVPVSDIPLLPPYERSAPLGAPVRPPTAVGSSQNRAALQTMSSRVSAPTAPITPQAAQKEGETRPGPILPSKSSIGQPSPATVPLVPPKGPYLGSPRKASNDPSSKLPEDPHHGKLSDSVGLTQPSGASSFAF